jgi:hypothetical protein
MLIIPYDGFSSTWLSIASEYLKPRDLYDAIAIRALPTLKFLHFDEPTSSIVEPL